MAVPADLVGRFIIAVCFFAVFADGALPANYDQAQCSPTQADLGIPDYTKSWDLGIVPYNFPTPDHTDQTKAEVVVTMSLFEKYTCIRFKPYPFPPGETYGLTNIYNIGFQNTATCSSFVGNTRSMNQFNTCCWRNPCLHEIGHSLGFFHEHQDVGRRDFVQAMYEKIDPGAWMNLETSSSMPARVKWMYDTFDPMHYLQSSQWRLLYGDLQLVREQLNFPYIQPDWFYLFKDVSRFHKCDSLHGCTGTCENDGYLTKYRDQCGCVCPLGLDPATSCSTVRKQVTNSPLWPAGSYALFAPGEGCPAGTSVFATGSWQHYGEGSNTFSTDNFLGGTYTASTFKYNFCVKSSASDSAGSPNWERGNYCILKSGNCPTDFELSDAKYYDSSNPAGAGTGTLPSGNFGGNTKLKFCCRSDGFRVEPMDNVPNTAPLVLLNSIWHDSEGCQEIAGMRSYAGWISFDSFLNPEVTPNDTITLPSGITTGKLNYCYYRPLVMSCGGEITLSSTANQAIITSPSFPNSYSKDLYCTWLVKTENPNDKILLNFNALSLTSSDPHCMNEDNLEIRYNLLGQVGLRFCGNYAKKTVRSMHNYLTITLRTDGKQTASDVGFNLTASLFTPSTQECYDPASRGAYYRGQKNYTREMEPCLPWASVSHCNHSTFDPRDYSAGLENNYCRNPDNTAMPWCYILDSADYPCSRDYCDVCNIEKVYDRKHELCQASVCSQSRDEIVALGCADTCNVQPPPAPVRTTTCGQPPSVTDGTLVGTVQSSYNVGDNVTYQCSSGNEKAVSTCLSDGQWSRVAFVCGGCREGWGYWGGACYRVFTFPECGMNYSSAGQYCVNQGARLAKIPDFASLDLIVKLKEYLWDTYIGLSDKDNDGQYSWEDGSALGTFWVWANGPPGTAGSDCVVMNTLTKTWDTINCAKTQRQLACSYQVSGKAAGVCSDRITNCQSVFALQSQACDDSSFHNQQCAWSCGDCDLASTPQCPTTAPFPNLVLVSPTAATVPRGTIVRYDCSSGYMLKSGNLAMVCGNNGLLVGPQTVCTSLMESNDVALINRTSSLVSGYSYLLGGTKTKIDRYGFVRQWKYFSRKAGNTYFQIWRPLQATSLYKNATLVGSNQVQTKGLGVETYDVPEHDWIRVQPGDLIGVWEDGSNGGGVQYSSSCSGTQTAFQYEFYFVEPSSSKALFSKQLTYVTSYYGCQMISFKAMIMSMSEMPVNQDQVTNQVCLVKGNSYPASKQVLFGDGSFYTVRLAGQISSWEFFNGPLTGDGAFQVWRLVDAATESYQLVGQNLFNATNDQLYKMSVPEENRIAVQAGDIVAVWAGATRWAVTYNNETRTSYPEAGQMRSLSNYDATTATAGDVRAFSVLPYDYTFVFAFRAVVDTAGCLTAPIQPHVLLVSPIGQVSVPAGTNITYTCETNYQKADGNLQVTCSEGGKLTASQPTCALLSVDLIARPLIQDPGYSYMGAGMAYTVQQDGIIKKWQYYGAKSGGTTVFQVWRPTTSPDSFKLIGQVQFNPLSTGVNTYDVPEYDWITVKQGDRLAQWENSDYIQGEIKYSLCTEAQPVSYFGFRKSPYSKTASFSMDIPTTFDTTVSCYVFSFKAIVDTVVPTTSLTTSNKNLLVSRPSKATTTNYITILGTGSAWKLKSGGTGWINSVEFYNDVANGYVSVATWRPTATANTFKLVDGMPFLKNPIGRRKLVPRVSSYGLDVAAATGDFISIVYVSYAANGAGWTNCSLTQFPDGGGIYEMKGKEPGYDIYPGETAVFTPVAGACRIPSVRIIV